MTNTIRIAFYLRSATGDLADLKRQFKTLKTEIVRRGFDPETSLIEVYRDTHQSGLRSGPEFERMTRDAKRGKIDVVMVSRLNRVSRSLRGLFSFYDFVKIYPIRFLSAEDNIDSDQWHFHQRPTIGSPQVFLSTLTKPKQRKEHHQ